MLSDQDIELLTAFVDGELDQRQRKAAMRLLEKLSEARALLKQLQENVHALKKLPKHKVEPSLVDDVLQAIAAQQVQLKLKSPAPRRRPWLPYVAGFIAATVLIAVFEIVYWKTVSEHPAVQKGPDIVKIDDAKKIAPIPTPVEPPRKKENPWLAKATAITENTHRDFSNYVPPKPYEAAFGELARVESKASGEFAHQVNREVNREKSVHLEITVNSNKDAMTRLGDVLKERQINLVADPAVNKILDGKSKAKVEFLVYAENLTTDDVTKLMRELGHQYVVGAGMNQKMVNSPYKKVTVAPSEPEVLQAVAKLFGVEVSAVDLKNRKEVKNPPKSQRQAVVLPATGTGAPSTEVRQFLNQRQSPQVGTLQVIIKIRQE